MTLSRFLQSRHLVRGILAVLVLFAAVRIGFPFLIQTDTVGREIERTLEAWTGAEVDIGREPEFSFWPYPKVTLGNIRIVTADRTELARIEALSASFDLFGAVRGKPVFSDFDLVRPTIHVGWNAAGVFNWRHSGWLMQAIDATKSAPDGEAIPELPEERIGMINVVNGIVDV